MLWDVRGVGLRGSPRRVSKWPNVLRRILVHSQRLFLGDPSGKEMRVLAGRWLVLLLRLAEAADRDLGAENNSEFL